jgi:DNA-binding transcriptional MocR family regulator
MKLYKQLAADLSVLIRQGALKPGDRVPSVRATSRERGMSPAPPSFMRTSCLEGQGFIETRPRLNYGHPWTTASERAIKALGAIVRS